MGSIHLNEESWNKINDYTRLMPTEIACMGYATLKDGDVNVSELFLVPQDVSSASVDFLEKGFPWAVAKAIEEDRVNELRFIWHSHCNFNAFFSSIDEDMVEKVRDSGPIPWLANLVLNKKGETHAQIDYFRGDHELFDFTGHVTVDLDLKVDGVDDRDDLRMEEIESLVERKKYVSTTKTYVAKPGGKLQEIDDSKITHGQGAVEQKAIQLHKLEPKDWQLHNKAKEEKWTAAVDSEQMVHYYDEQHKKYQGKAPLPINDAGEPKIKLNLYKDHPPVHFAPKVTRPTGKDTVLNWDSLGPNDWAAIESMSDEEFEEYLASTD